MSVQQLLQSHQLDAAIEALSVEVRNNPTDTRRRTFLFELLCFAGAFDRAEKQLAVLAQQGPQAEMGVLLYRAALAAEKTRQEMFETDDRPKQSSPASLVSVHGMLNAKPFHSLTDSDSRLGAQLEVFAAGTYMRIPFAMISSIHMDAPKRLRDLLWRPAVVRPSEAFQERELGEVLIPVVYPGSSKHADQQVRLGRLTVWEEAADGATIPYGQRVLETSEEEWPFLEIRDLSFEVALSAH
jgi:type VI secretion system protein ImpE